jgi:hypothetical protein
VNLSECTSLEFLDIPVPINVQKLVNDILPSISSSELSRISLNVIQKDGPWDPQFLKTLEKRLCRVAKKFKTAHGGRKVVVQFHIWWSHEIFTIFQGKRPMPELREEAMIDVSYYNLGRTGFPSARLSLGPRNRPETETRSM